MTLISTHAGFSNSSKRIKNRGGKVTTHINDASEFSNVKFKRITDDKGGINMCKGMELCLLDTEIKGSIKTFRSMNVSEDEIIERVAELFNVKKDYVKELMKPKAV